jgi:elongation factor G
VIAALRVASERPLVVRELPLQEGEALTGYVDLASGRGYAYKPNAASDLIDVPADHTEAVAQARYAMLEQMADFDDSLMEKLLEDVDPGNEEVFVDLTKIVGDGDIVPVMFGAGELDHGVRRLLKALRHDAPGAEQTLARIGIDGIGPPLAQVLKTYNQPNVGKLSLVRVWRGTIRDGDTLDGVRPSGIFAMLGHQTKKLGEATAGDVIALGRLEEAATGDTLSAGKGGEDLPRASVLPPVYALAINAANRDDEVKLSGAMTRLVDEDPSLSTEHMQDTNELLLRGQGEMHLRVAVERLKNKFGLEVVTERPKVPYKEAIRKPVSQHGRFKRQTGGHGQFGDVHIEIKPLPRGSGVTFDSSIVGGVIPKQYIPAVESGVREYLRKGPLGHPVVDVSITLTDGSYHSVDSSELAFKTAGSLAMREGVPQCGPVLLEPILKVAITVPSEFTPKVNTLVSSRRGQILGFEGRPGWQGWDVVTARMPQVEVLDMIVELRSLSQGVGTFTSEFDHLQELVGRLADQVLAAEAAE